MLHLACHTIQHDRKFVSFFLWDCRLHSYRTYLRHLLCSLPSFPTFLLSVTIFLLTSPALRIQDFFHNIEKTVVVSIIFYWIMSDSVRYHIPQETISFLLR
mmetsp:Transcript_11934/g.25184  ORF Transcript_11934/g.25184 Transcript_11934/m.25184 type:complete len:101 (-) Transcript_11934:392-694(-)